MKKKATITVKTERLLVIAQSRRPVNAWCEGCARATEFMSVEEAAALAGMTQRKIFHLAEGGQIHLRETTSGRALFCATSLTQNKVRDNEISQGDPT
jgi:hypothetical protein